MPDQFGALELPSSAELDPALDALSAFFAAVIVADLADVWDDVGTGRSVAIQRFTHDPERGEFNDRDLPALFLWRKSSSEEPVRLADDYELDRVRVAGLWIFPPAVQHKQVTRTKIFNGVTKSLRRACRQLRNPAWVADDDTDPEAATRGSHVLAIAEIAQLRFRGSSTEPPVMIEIADSHPLRYPAVHFAIEIDEILAEDAASYAGGTSGEAALTATFGVNPGRDDSFPDALDVGSFEDPEEP